MMLKNYGVTRHRRVVLYDYDELRLLTDCRFREITTARAYGEEVAAEPWYSVGPDDVFPDELGRFIGLTGELRDAFLTHLIDLLDILLAPQPAHVSGEAAQL